jgi:hypothetical protein
MEEWVKAIKRRRLRPARGPGRAFASESPGPLAVKCHGGSDFAGRDQSVPVEIVPWP